MKSALSFVAVAVALTVPAWAEAKDQITNSVVKIYATKREPDFQRPWAKRSPVETSGSGAIIKGRRILTNAHVVLYASQLFVQADQTTERVPAKVVAVAPGIDLAVIEVDKPSFFDGRPPLPLADGIAAVKQSVSVYGYPVGGEQISVTQGIVSRIEYVSVYYMALRLRIQIDAALNPGNSGGPAISDGRIVGLVFSKFTSGENIGYLIAADEIRTFLKDIQHGRYGGKPQLWDYLQTTENEALRAKLGLEKQSGLIVSRPFSDAPDYPLKRWDVITRIGDDPLDSRGNVKVRDDLRLYFQYLVPKLARNGRVKLTILRDRKTSEVEVPVRADADYVVPFLFGQYPRYFIYGPMVFMPASQELTLRLLNYSALGVDAGEGQEPAVDADHGPPGVPGRGTRHVGLRAVAAQDVEGLQAGFVQRRQPRQRQGRPQFGPPRGTSARRQGRVSHDRPGRRRRVVGLSTGRSPQGDRRHPFRRRHPQAILRRPGERLASREEVALAARP